MWVNEVDPAHMRGRGLSTGLKPIIREIDLRIGPDSQYRDHRQAQPAHGQGVLLPDGWRTPLHR